MEHFRRTRLLVVALGAMCAGAAVAAPTEQYLHFDPAGDGMDFVDTVSMSDLSLTGGAFTLSAWINPTGWGERDQGRILDHGGGNGTLDKGWSLHLENKSNRGRPQALRIQINDDKSFDGQSDVGAVTLNQWQHVAATLSGGTLTFYVNGQPAGVRTGVPAPTGTSTPVRVGMVATGLTRGFDGGIDEVRIWDRALSQAEIQAQMNAELNGTEVGLVLYYPLNDASGQIATDFSPNGHHGQLGSTTGADVNDPAWASNIPDTENPVVTLTAPTNGSTVGGTTPVTASATDNIAVASVLFAVDGSPIGEVLSSPYTMNWDTATVANGPYTVSATATDTSGNAASDTISITVDNGAPVNQPPTVDAGAAQTVRLPNDSASLDATVTDDGVSGVAVTTLWTQTGGPAGVTFADAGAVDTTATFPGEGTYVLNLAADDGEYNVSDAVTVTVEAAAVLTTLTVSPDGTTVAPNGTRQFTVSGADQYGDAIATTPVWTATAGSIDGTGLYTAGATEGPFSVTATDGSVSDQATGSISDAPLPTETYLDFNFGGDGMDYVGTASTGLALQSGAFTLSAWIRPESWGHNDQGRVLDNGGGNGALDKGWSLHLENKSSLGRPQALRMQINDDKSFNGLSDVGVVTLNQWQHVAATVDAGTLTFYVNGQPVGVRTGIPVPIATTNPVRVGMAGTSLTRGFDGGIDDVSIWDRALSQAEIQAQMSQQLSGTEPQLLLYYPFNEGSGQSAIDFSPNGHHGQLGSTASVDGNDPAWGTTFVDSEAPLVTLTAPSAGATVGGTTPVSATATDNVGVNSVVFAVDGLPIGEVLSAPYTFNWDTTTVANGTYTLSASASDAAGNVGNNSYAITVDNGTPVNQPPAVNAGADQSVRLPQDTASLDGTVSDDGLSGVAVTTLWTQTGGPAGVTFADAGTVDTTATFPGEGTYVLNLAADDGEYNVSDAVTVTVEAAAVLTTLTVSPDGTTVAPNGTRQFTVSGADQYGDAIATTPVWTATAGSIDGTGLYTAGATEGPFSVTATDGSVSDQATGSISDAPLPTETYLDFNFGGDGMDYVGTASTGLALQSGAFTLSAWIRPESWGHNDQGRVLDNGGGNGALDKGWSLHLENKSSLGRPQALRMQINDDKSFNGLSDVGVVTLNQWQHVAATVDAGTLTFYVNGQPVGVRTGIPVPIATTNPVRVGMAGTSLTRGFDGGIDDVSIWDRALSQAEIQAQMSQQLSGTEPQLLLYYPFNEGSGQSAIDFSPNGHHGQLGSTASVDGNDPAWGTTFVDSEAPLVTLTAPSAGATVGGTTPVSATATDNVGVNSVVFAVDGLPIGEVLSAPYTFNWDTTTVANGTYTLSASASDAAGNVGNNSYAITVDNGTPVNQPPAVNAGADQSVRLPQDTASLDGTVSDDGLSGVAVTTLWTQTGGPAGVTFADAGTVDTTATFPGEGTYVLNLAADDGEYNVSDAVTVTVEAEPELTSLSVIPSNTTLAPSDTEQFSAEGTDQYGDPISVSPDWSATGGTIDGNGFYTAGPTVGDYTVTAIIGDVTAPAAISISEAPLPTDDYLQFSFPGDGTDYVETASTTALNLKGASFTLSAWINPASWGDQDQGRILDHGGGNGTLDRGWSLHLENKASSGSPQALRIQINDDKTFNGTSDVGVIALNQWQHVAASVDAGTLTFYVNGQPAGVRTGIPIPRGTSTPIRIGVAATGLTRAFNGGIDEVRIWDRSLSQAEIQAQMNQQLNGTEPGLVLYYPLNEGSGQLATDFSPIGHHGQLGSTPGVDVNDPAWTTTAPVNQPPVVDAGADQMLTLPTDTANLDATVSDDGLSGAAVTTLWTQVSGPAGVVFGDANLVDTTATFPGAGTYGLMLTADDGEFIADDTLSVTVNPEPDTEVPVVTLTAPSGASPLSGTVAVTATATDNVSVVSVVFAVNGSPIGEVFSAPYTLNWDTTTVANGMYTVSATATDPSSNVGNDSVVVDVDNNAPVNQPPVVDAGNGQTIRLPVDTASLDGTVTDDGLSGFAVTTLWTQTGGPAGVLFGDDTAIDTSATFPGAGTYELTLAADDGEFNASDVVSIEVETAPALASIAVSPSATTLVPNGSEQFSATGTDQYGDPIATSPAWSATGGTIDANGLYTAGTTEGSFAVTATDGPVNGQGTVTISDAVAPTDIYLTFDPAADGVPDYVELAPASDLHLTGGAFTLSAWINPANWGESDQGRIIDQGGGNSVLNKGWSFHLENKPTLGAPMALRMQINNDSSFDGTSDTNVVTLNTWQHVAATFDAGTLSFFVNGQPAGVRTGVPVPSGATVPVRIGTRALSTARGFAGGIDEVRIWSRALSQVEIQTMMNQTLNGTETGLVAYFPLDVGFGQDVTDFSPNGHHSVLGSTAGVDSNDPAWGSEQPINLPPAVDAGDSQGIVLPTDTAQLDATVSDDGLSGVPVTTLWTQESGPAGVVFGDANAVDTSATFPGEGSYILKLTADDGQYVVSDTTTVTVSPEPDVNPPVITLLGSNPQFVEKGFAYVEAGATAQDDRDGDISANIVIDASAVNTGVAGDYTVTYDVSDAFGNAATQVLRTVTVTADVTAPVITLTGANPQFIERGFAYVEAGATAMDQADGDLTGSIAIDSSQVNTAAEGSYTVTYDVMDSAGNAAQQVQRTVTVTADVTPPTLTLLGNNPLVLLVNTPYNEPGATAFDQLDGDITGDIVINSSNVNVNVPGHYIVTYNVADMEGNAAPQAVRNVTIEPETGPYQASDNTDSTVVYAGAWSQDTNVVHQYGIDYQVTPAGNGSASATFSFDIALAGNYQVAGWFTSNLSRGSDVPYDIYNNGNLVDSVSVNQANSALQGQFNQLGTYAMAAGTVDVVISSTGSGTAAADAVALCLDNTCPSQQITSPAWNHVTVNGSVSFTVTTEDYPPGWGVEFVLNGDDANGTYYASPPFTHDVNGLPQGEHVMETFAVDENNIRRDEFFDVLPFAYGDFMVAFGASIVNGSGDNIASDNVSMDGRNSGGGFEPILNDLLTAARSYPHSVANAGVSGDTTMDGLARLPGVLTANADTQYVLMLIGTNDAKNESRPSGLGLTSGQTGYANSYKDNLQQMISMIQGTGKEPVLGYLPIIKPFTSPVNALIQEYNSVMDELVTANGLNVTPPDFYTHFENNPGQYSDLIHPNGEGYQAMAQLWADALLLAFP